MNVLFLTLVSFDTLQVRNIYTDLLREFVKNEHNVYVISPTEKREGKETHIVKENCVTILRLKIGNMQKANIIEKGISTLYIGPTLKGAIKNYFLNVKFDLVLYSTPPITFVGAIEYVKKRDRAKTYLLLKDIFPQNAVDIGIMSKGGLKGLLYRYFRRKEKKLYAISDRIGCMSQANVRYVLKYNPEVRINKVEVCPNSIEVVEKSVNAETRRRIREKYGLPQDKKVFVYGGNLGKPQGIPFLIECLKRCSGVNIYFLIVGDGTEYGMLEEYVRSSRQKNLKLMKSLPKEDYDDIVGACDVGMVFLDHRFAIPNFPSRLLSYMAAKIPILAVTDSNTDIGKIIVDGGFGWWCESNDAEHFLNIASDIANKTMIHELGERGYYFLKLHYTSKLSYEIILSAMGEMSDENTFS